MPIVDRLELANDHFDSAWIVGFCVALENRYALDTNRVQFRLDGFAEQAIKLDRDELMNAHQLVDR